MALYYSIGRTLVPSAELSEKSQDLRRFSAGKAKSLSFRAGTLDKTEAMATRLALRGGEPRPFEPIGIGKPLAIWITSVYPGDLPPKEGFFGKSRGVLITSAVKSWQAFDMKPRALNILKKEAKRRTAIPGPAATEEGTPLVFYSPALVDRSLIVTFEIAFDDVDEDFLKSIGTVFASAAGLPVFASAAPYLLAAGALFKVGGTIGNRLFDSRAEFQGTDNIYLDVAGEPAAQAGFVLVTRSELDEKTLRDFFVESTGSLVNKNNDKPYQGEIPYVVMALDGRADTSLQTFASTAASAALLQRFYNVRENGETDAGTLVEALTFFNDFRYRKEALELQEKIQSADSEKEKKELQQRYDALIKNIQTPLFKPK